VAEPLDFVVPTRGMRVLQKLAQGDGDGSEVSIALDEGQRHVVFEAGDVTIGCQLGGKYPDYRALIPQEWSVRAVADRAALLRACRTAQALSEQGSLRIEFVPPGKLVVSSASVEAGDGKTELEAAVEGTEAEMTLNIRYLADAVAAVAGKQVAITAGVPAPPLSPPVGGRKGGAVVVQPVGASDLGLIMPMQPGR